MRRPLLALLALVLLTGCTGSPSVGTTAVGTPPVVSTTVVSPTAGTAPSPAATSATTSRSAETPTAVPSVPVTVIEISLKDGKVAPNGDRVAVDKGTILQLEITSDHADKVHVHGYDVEIAVKPGAGVTRRITLDQVGRFEIESHEPAFTILQLVVS